MYIVWEVDFDLVFFKKDQEGGLLVFVLRPVLNNHTEIVAFEVMR